MKTKKPIIIISLSALFTAIICILAQISVLSPFGVPITLQIFAISLCGYTLGSKYGFFSVTTYILIGAIGLPVFSGFKGGFQVLFSPTGGFILGFIVLVICCGLSNKTEKTIYKIILGLFGTVICHILGVLQFAFISDIGLLGAFLTVSLPFLPKDFLLVVLSFLLSQKILKRLKTA